MTKEAASSTLASPEPADAEGLDLDLLENTRLGFRIAGFGLLFVLCSIPWFGAHPIDLAMIAVRFAGWLLLTLAILLTPPTPNGPLPSWLKWPYAIVFALAALRVAVHPFGWLASHGEIESWVVPVFGLAFVALPWILWRFCQYRGLTGRALTWLWSAFLLLGVFALHWKLKSDWVTWLYPPLGILLFLMSKQTARDIWLDAIVRRTKAVVRPTA